jgi:NAD-dependent SIR2 family protein deacetylase
MYLDIFLYKYLGKLLRNYTQNVDGLERKAGISKVIECHGTMVSYARYLHI